jgi:hypothetical protein
MLTVNGQNLDFLGDYDGSLNTGIFSVIPGSQ